MANSYEGKLLTDAAPFAVSEAFKTMRTNLFYTAKGESCPVYGITSTLAASGKSLLISNLAVSYAQLEKRVLLIDCDLRNSVVHKIFGIERGQGLSELLAGAENSVDKFIRHTSYNNLSIITAGGTPPNPAELIASARMGKLLEFMKQHFDIIFIDLPPVAVVSDAVIIAEHLTGYLYAVRSGREDKRMLKGALAMMDQTGAHVVGLVMNDVNMKSGGYGKYGKYGYGRYGRYGYGRYGRYGYGRYGYGRYGTYGNGKTGYR